MQSIPVKHHAFFIWQIGGVHVRLLGKGNRERHVSFPDSVTITRLEAYRKYANSRFGTEIYDSLFLNGLGRPANEQYMRNLEMKILRKC